MKHLTRIFALLAVLAFSSTQAHAEYTIKLDIDNPEAVSITADNKDVTPQDGITEVTATELITVSVNTGYVFTRFTDDLGRDHLQYDNQTMPVNIRPSISTGMGESVSNDGLTFTVKTKSTAAERTIPLTVNVDDASKVVVKIGTSAYFTSGSNRTVDLSDGENTVYFSKDDKYVLISSTQLWTRLHRVQLDGKDLSIDSDYVYSGKLAGKAATLDIQVSSASDPGPKYTFTLDVDDTSHLRFFTRETDPEEELLPSLVDGENVITFTEGTRFSLWPDTTPAEITLDGTPVEPALDGKAYYFEPSDNSRLNVRFHNGNTPDVDYTVTMTFTNPGTESFIKFLQVNDLDVPVAEFANGRKVKAGDEIWLSYLRFDYIINDITVNGVSVGPEFPGSLLFTVTEDTEVVFDVTKPADVEFSIVVDHADRIAAYIGDRYDPNNMSTTLVLEDGANELAVPDNKTDVKLAPLTGFCITSVKDADGNSYQPGDFGIVALDVVSGAVYNVTTAPVSYDEHMCIYVEADPMPAYAMVTYPDYREISIDAGYNDLAFNSTFETDLLFEFGHEVWAYLDGAALSPADETTYALPVADGSILRIYPDAQPAIHNVTWDYDPESADAFVVMREDLQPVDPATANAELHNTRYFIRPAADNILLTVEAEGATRAADTAVVVTIADDTCISIKAETSGIGQLDADTRDADVYNLQGILVRRAGDSTPLPAGVYIAAGRKIAVAARR